MVIGKIEADGFWMFDTNFGKLGEYLSASKDTANYISDGKGGYREATVTEIESGLATHVWQEDNTVRYHFLSFNYMEEKVSAASIHRVPLK